MNILCGYNANIDAVYRITGRDVESILGEVDEKELLMKIERQPDIINSLEDFLAGLIHCMEYGRGAEWFIYSRDVLDFLKKRFFEEAEIRIGGNMGIMANVLSGLNVDMIVPNVVYLSGTQEALFSKRGMVLPPKFESQRGEEEPVHFVFDFRQGDNFDLYGRRITVSRENRFIATFDKFNPQMTISSFFKQYATAHIGEMDGAVVSGFHMLQPSYPDDSSFEEKLSPVLAQIDEWNSMPGFFIHAELGHFATSDIARHVFLKLAGRVDSMGLNEDELATLTQKMGFGIEGIHEMDISAMFQAARNCIKGCLARALVVHTRDFVFCLSASDNLNEQKIDAIDFGLKCAAYFASSGLLPDRSKLEEWCSQFKRSEYGSLQVKRIKSITGARQYGFGICGIFNEYYFCAIPTLVVNEPAVTVGLGDTFTASSFLRLLELRNRS
ncbi:ADP-dependent glucokinase/phosphofructokinase [Methanohalophilus sp. WG1-DM]|uniref:ADP-dependent glucokinase/phosphofructokinase n=1 Tax=Methanohalophilus sp. WG1-DM TaxID=2491675 RepID=UPI000FFE355A|nr:ADP-dependent glucokinase/phosphofructokinase [Methanohalophilus sp. WG1-DM]RXG34937.1 ADP-dependent phosphofructokinase/glucokinase [Methanohalophilus sp. WG1-DM]